MDQKLFMRAFLLLFSTLLSSYASSQPIKNASFENWSPIPSSNGNEGPDHWLTNNGSPVHFGAPVVFKSDDAVDGTYSVKIIPVRMVPYGPNAYKKTQLYFYDTISFVPTKVKGYYKLSADSFVKEAFIEVCIHNDSATTIGSCNIASGGMEFISSAVWTPFEVVLNLAPNTNNFPPKIITCIIELRANDTVVVSGNFLAIDGLTVEPDPTSVETVPFGKAAEVYTYPNPATEHIHFKLDIPVNIDYDLEIYDHSGRFLLAEKTPGIKGDFKLNIGTLAPGIYFYRIGGIGMEDKRGSFFKISN